MNPISLLVNADYMAFSNLYTVNLGQRFSNFFVLIKLIMFPNMGCPSK